MQMNNCATLSKFSQLPFGDMIEVVTKILCIIVMVDMYSKHISALYNTIHIDDRWGNQRHCINSG